MIRIETSTLQRLLEKTQRKHTVAGSTKPQVVACMLRSDGNTGLSVTSLVKDGVTSLFRFSCDTRPQTTQAEVVPIPDIERIKGALKFHGGILNITFEGGKLRLKSGKKSTTLLASENAKAFPHSPHSLLQWETRSRERAESVDSRTAMYTMRDGTQVSPMLSVQVDAVELFEAVRCISMNSQKSDTFTFTLKDSTLSVTVGENLKGSTTTIVCEDIPFNDGEFEAKFKGGLNHILKYLNGNIFLSFLDFRSFNQGVAMLITHGPRDFIYQSGVIQ